MTGNTCVLTKNDATKALDNINSCINGCDTKASIMLGFCATIIALCISPDFLSAQSKFVLYFIDNICFLGFIVISFHFAAIVIFIIGTVELLMVVVPRVILESGHTIQMKSVLFFGSIAKNTPTFEEYCVAVQETTDEAAIFKDLLFQIHSAAIICSKKIHHQQIGLILTSIAIIVFFITTIIGNLAISN